MDTSLDSQPAAPASRPALEFAADPVMADQIRGFCRYLLAGSPLAEVFPGLTAEDLCQDVLVSLADHSCAGAGQFWKLFEISARRLKIDLLRKSQTRQKHLDLLVGHQMEEELETPPDSHHAFAAQREAAEKSGNERVEEIALLLERMPIEERMRPVLEAIVHEARTGERISDKEISLRTGLKQNSICRMRARLRSQAAAYLALPLLTPLRPKSWGEAHAAKD